MLTAFISLGITPNVDILKIFIPPSLKFLLDN